MTPSRFIPFSASFGLLLGYVQGFGADWVQLAAFTAAGGITGFAIIPARGVNLALTKKKVEDE